MFINFEFLMKGHEASVVEAIVSTPKEATDFAGLLQFSDRVIAWKMLTHKPSDFGWGTDGWSKLRLNNQFTSEDWAKARGEISYVKT